MKAILTGAVMALTITTAGAAEVGTNSANFWVPYCQAWFVADKNAPVRQGICVGIVEGVAFASCVELPEGVNVPQLVRVVLRYIEARPQRMHESFPELALEALRDAWPCRKER
jgi:C4-dicarboxylate transporter